MSYTPQRLADKILTSRAMLEGERKQVSVLFADIKDSMELLTARDPEVAQTLLLDPVLERMIEAVHRYEGTVHRVMGDGIMALFGAPLALEDHAVRACYAALRMQETVKHYAGKVQLSHGVPLAIRVGLNSGEIVIRAIGDDLQMDYTVVGQTANLASRMEQMARAGSVLTTADTQHLAEGYIEMKPLGPMPVKGLADPIPIYEVMGAGSARTRLQTAAQRGLTRFVGRDVELEKLRRAQQLAHGGHGQVVAIIGGAGVGKSRLVHEFVHSHQTAGWLILETGSTSYSRATPYLPFIELLRHYFNINVHDKTESIREKVTSRIVALDQSLKDAVPPLLDLLDSLDDKDPFRSLDPLPRAQCTSQALIRLLLSESRVQPLIAVFEDLHFIDSVTTGLLNELVVSAQNERVLLVASYRPEFTDLWGSWPSYHELRLEPLTRGLLADFNHALLGSDPSLRTLKGFLAERASGNPFFVEEIVRSLVDIRVLEGARGSYRIERPFLSVDVPPTVQSVLAARVDALPTADKRLLMEAAVIGFDVPFTLLHAISGLTEDRLRGLLDTLQASEFLYATQIFPDLQYTFKHYLTHEVTYNGVLRERRREIHRRVVDAIEKLHDGRLGEHVDRLAHHAVQGELHEKAVHYLRQAGRRAAARSALSDARACFEQALNVLTALPESQIVLGLAFEIHLELRSVLRQLGEVRQMLEHLREAEAIAEQLEDDRRRCEVCAFSTNIQSTLGELDAALETGARALEIAERLGDPRLRIVTISALEQAYHYRGEYVRVAESAPGNLAALPADWSHEFFGMAVPASVFVRAWLIMSLAELGRFAEASKYSAEVIQIAEPTKHAHTIGWAHLAATMLHLVRGDWTKALSRVEPWIGMFRSGNVVMHLPWAIASFAWTLAEIGEASEALIRVQEAEQLLEHQVARGIFGHCSWAYHSVGRACLSLGRLDDAWRLGYRSVELSQRQPGFTAHALRLLGDLATHPHRFDAERGEAHYRQALTLGELHSMRPLVARCHLAIGHLYLRTGKSDDAREHLSTAIMMHREMDLDIGLGQEAADILSGEIGNHDQ